MMEIVCDGSRIMAPGQHHTHYLHCQTCISINSHVIHKQKTVVDSYSEVQVWAGYCTTQRKNHLSLENASTNKQLVLDHHIFVDNKTK
jgi:hypothetical protein